jgi:hypothetical protein
MKKLLFAALLTVALAFGQATGGSTDSKTGKHGKVTKTKKGAKGKKSSGGTTTQPPK